MNTLKLKTRKPIVENNIGSIFDSFFKPDFFGGIDPYHRSPFKKPEVNISETENFYQLEFSAPGRKKADFTVEVEDGILVVSATKKETTVEEAETYKRKEFHFEEFKRSFVLPEEVNDDSIEGSYEDGILTVKLPKTEKAIKSKKQIEIS